MQAADLIKIHARYFIGVNFANNHLIIFRKDQQHFLASEFSQGVVAFTEPATMGR